MSGFTYIGNTSGKSEKLNKSYIGDSNNKSRTVQKIYVGNSNNKSVCVWPIPILPLAYQQVSYIFNTNNTEYINTGVKPNSDTRCWMDFNPRGRLDSLTWPTDNSCLFGCSSTYSFHVYGGGTNYHDYNTIQFAGEGFTKSGSILRSRHTVEINRSGGYMYIDNTQIGRSTKTFSTINYSLFLFANNNNGTPKFASFDYGFYLYQFKVWQSNTLIRDMYPCYLKSDTQAIGMYDLIENKFYGNDGTGIFYKGPDVN